MTIVYQPDMAAVVDDLASDCDACERSWSVHEGGVEERFLFFFEQGEETAQRLAQAAVRLGLPPGLLRGWSHALPGADAVGLALNRDGSSVRLYVQYWEAVRVRVQGGDLSPVPLYLGFKALPSGVARVDGYVCLPAAPREEFWPDMAHALDWFGAERAMAEVAFAPLTAEKCIFTRTTGAGRESWLATVRRADLDVRAVADCLAPGARAHGAATLSEALERGAPLVHLAGGTDAEKGRFLTIYLEAQPQEIVALVNPRQT